MVSMAATEHQFDFDGSWAESFEMKRRLGNAQEARMAKLSLAMMTVVLLIGLTVSANASTLTGVSGLPNLTKGYSPIEASAALADRVDAPAAAGFGAAGGTGAAACADGGGKAASLLI